MKSWTFMLALLLSTQALATTRKLTYDELPTLIRASNSGLKAAEKNLESTRLATGFLSRSYLPQLHLETGIHRQQEADGSRQQVPFWKLDASSNLYRSGRDTWKDQELEYQAALREADVQVFQRKTLLKMRLNYLRLAAVREQLQVHAEASNKTRAAKKSLQKKIQAGLLAESLATDFLLWEQTLDQNYLFLDKDMHELEDGLIFALGFSHDTELAVSHLSRIDMGAEPEPSQLQSAPVLSALMNRSKNARSAAKLSSEWWRPQVDAFASHTNFRIDQSATQSTVPSQETQIGIKLTFDLRSQAELRSEANRLNSEAAAFDLERTYQNQELELELHEYSHDINALQAIIQKTNQQIQTAKTLQARIDSEFDRGIRDSAAVLESMRRLLELRIQHIKLQLEYAEAKAGLRTLLGS